MKLLSAALGSSIAAFILLASLAQAGAAEETVLHRFGHGMDGRFPEASVIDKNGTLYGTTPNGGAYNQGTVFAVRADTGKETVLYSFCSQQDCADGAEPVANLIDVTGTLVGTTLIGGNAGCGTFGSGCGTIFSLDPATGAETVLYTFCSAQNCTDGASPQAGLIAVKGTLYGTTMSGGSGTNCEFGGGGCGTVFALDPKTRTETVLYSFCGQQNCVDGGEPSAGLLYANGKLYGTGFVGGTGVDGYHGSSGGVIFEIDLSTSEETVLYSFCSKAKCADGDAPTSNLITMNGTLYGTAGDGGIRKGCGIEGCGTLFAYDLGTSTESLLYAFCSLEACADGKQPAAGVIDMGGVLYGTTFEGGADKRGTVFAFDPGAGSEQVVYSFCRNTHCGSLPSAGLIAVNGTLYGTTDSGGPNGGSGTVFSVTP